MQHVNGSAYIKFVMVANSKRIRTQMNYASNTKLYDFHFFSAETLKVEQDTLLDNGLEERPIETDNRTNLINVR